MELDPPDLHLRPRLRGAGYSDKEIRRMIRTGGGTARPADVGHFT